MLMFRLANASNSSGAIHDPDMQEATITAIRKQLVQGQLNLAESQGQLLFGKAMLNEALSLMRSARLMNLLSN